MNAVLCNTFDKITMAENGNDEEVPKEESIEAILAESKIVQHKFDNIKGKFFQAIFNSETKYDETMFRNNHYDWLHSTKAIPKELGEPVPNEHLELLEFETEMPKLYTSLQIMVITMEEVFKSEKYNEFKGLVVGYLKTLLEEITDAMFYAGIQTPSNISQDILPADFCNIRHLTFLRIRDWLVFRECMNLVEYMVAVFSYLQQVYS